MGNFRLAQLQTFSKVIELGSFSATAEFFKVTQPAITIQIRELEKALGVRLIERPRRKVIPTQAGKELLKHIDKIDEAISKMFASMKKHRADAGE